jgi:HSP20 family protein
MSPRSLITSTFFSSSFEREINQAIPQPIFPNRPVSNYYIEEDGTSIVEIATTGFSKDEIKVEVEGDLLHVCAEKKEQKQIEGRRIVHERIYQENFEIKYKLSSKMDVNSIKTKMENGILQISIAMKEEEKPIKKQILIE